MADDGVDRGLPQQVLGQGSILADRRQDHDLPADSVGQHLHFASVRTSVSSFPSCVGTPVSTPLNSFRGLPISIRPFLRLNSRIVRSCCPLRFLTTEIACRMSPRDSKYRSRMIASAR